MPAFTPGNAPTFDQIIEDDNAITLSGTVAGSEKYQLEFLVVDESTGRAAPRVIHMGIIEGGTFSLQVPKDYADPVWLVITSDLTGDGPTEDDLIGGSPEAIAFGTTDLNLSYTLTVDPDFLEGLPWYSKAEEGVPPEQPGGASAPGAPAEGTEDGAP